MDYNKLLEEEKAAFDKQTEDRIKNGFVPDLRRLVKVKWFYNNAWRDPEFVKIHWLPRINNIICEVKSSGRRVLEVGCGYGILSLELARNGLDVVGVDVSPKSIEVAIKYRDENPYNETFGSLQYSCADFFQMEFENGQFDSVVFFRSLHHMAEPDRVLEKVSNMLRKGGKLIISEPVRGHYNRESAHFTAVLRAVLPTWVGCREKIDKEWKDSVWKKEVDDILEECVMEGNYEQSPLDNTINNADDIINLTQKKFKVREKTLSDAFIDKLIGGLRGEHKLEFARFLKFLDEYMVRNNMLPPTSLELVAIKR